MRKFKITDQVAKKLKGLDNTAGESYTPVRKESARDAKGQRESVYVISRTDIGLMRGSNQDAVILGYGLMGVADGMGGHNGGEIASATARDGMLREVVDSQPDAETLKMAVKKVNTEIFRMQEQDEKLSGMGTTLTLLWPAEEKMLVGHVGDSRAYLLRDGAFRQVTSDHSMVADMVRRGMLTEEQAATHPMRNYITRAVGTEEDIQVDLIEMERQRGDRWLVCSDGLHGMVPKERLKELLSEDDLNDGADQMIREALEHGGRDNITLVIAEDRTGPERTNEATERSSAKMAEDSGISPELTEAAPEATAENHEPDDGAEKIPPEEGSDE